MGAAESTSEPLYDITSRQKNYSKETQVAVDAVLRGCQVAQAVAKSLISAETITKKDNSPVTVADYSVQAVINTCLKKSFPDDPIVAEEKSKDLKSQEAVTEKVVKHTNSVLEKPLAEADVLKAIDEGDCEGYPVSRFWTLDPIDGTKGFLRKEQYAVCLALIVNGEVVLGVLGCPNLPFETATAAPVKLGVLFFAVKGEGAYQRSLEDDLWSKIAVSKTSDPKETSFVESVEAGHSSHDDAGEIAKLLKITAAPVRMDSQCKYGSLARGDASIYMRLPTSATYQEKIWDHAAGSLIVTEAGGLVSDTTGQSLDFTAGKTLSRNKGVIASNPAVHAKVLGAVEYVLYPPTQNFRVSVKREFTTAADIHRVVTQTLGLNETLVSVELLSSSSPPSSSSAQPHKPSPSSPAPPPTSH